MASQYGIAADTKQRTQGTRGGVGAYKGATDASGFGSLKNTPFSTENLEKDISVLPDQNTFSNIKKKVGMGLIGAGVGVANALSQNDGMKVSQPYSTEGVLQSARNLGATIGTIPETAKNAVIGVGRALDSSIVQPLRQIGSSTQPSNPIVSTTPTVTPSPSGADLQVKALGSGATAQMRPEQVPYLTPQVSGTPRVGTTDNLTASQGPDGLSINTPSGGTGTISFQDGRQLSPGKLGQLQKDIAYNSLQSTKDKFAREAAIVAQRHADYDAYKASRVGEDLNPFLRAALQSKENTANTISSARLGAAQIQAQAANQKADLEERKMNLGAGQETVKIMQKNQELMSGPRERLASLKTANPGLLATSEWGKHVHADDPEYQLARDSGLEGLKNYYKQKGWEDQDIENMLLTDEGIK